MINGLLDTNQFAEVKNVYLNKEDKDLYKQNNMERIEGQQTTEQGHEAYFRIVEGNLPEIAQEVEMQPNVEYSVPQRIVQKVREILGRDK